ncbi:unnamed protein product [Mytilus edulis]|uniref:Endonuclease/exonuclease/phosphatase domain-containing protein n=1 Tax=Mytilus edulis TaxID=6550 RepID=A0A8S3S7E7_MYTED|nr:unnamed protein product [Mytilus edulis]
MIIQLPTLTSRYTHQIIIGGDFNEDIINGASSQRKKCINDFMQDHELSSKETGLTFIHSNGKDATAIDFILYQNKYSENIIDIKKLNVTSNVSDHYPILLSVLHHQKKLNTSEKSQISTKTFNKRIKWDKIDTGKYASLISTEISSTRCKIQNREDIVSGFSTLNNIIIKATKVFAPKSNKGKKKPKLQVMNEEIRKAISNKKVAFYNWKNNGSINDQHNYYLKQKKLTTYELRKQCRLEIALRRINERQKLIESKVSDTKTFFRMIRNQRGKMSKHIDELNVDGQIYNSDNQIINGWHIHFEELAKKSVNTKFDHKHLENVEKEVKVISDICQERYIHMQVTNKEKLKKDFGIWILSLHGTNGLDPETILTLVKTYVLPILTYGLEILIPKGKSLTTLNLYHKKLLKQLLSLSTNTADPAIYILSGMIPIEAELHIKILTLFGTISRSEKTSNEWRIAERQLKLKSFNSNSWFIDIKKICLLYNIENIEKYLDNPLTKSKWKSFIDNKVQSYWTNKILDDSKMYSTLQYMNCQYTIGKIHPLITTKTANNRDIVRIPSRTKIATGTYIFQSNRASFNKNKVNPTCKLCNKSPETLSHFLLTCESLEMVRKRLVDIIIDMGSELLAKSYFAEEVDLVQLIVNPFYYTVNKCNNEIVQNIAGQLERVCRQLINNLHMKRYDLLTKQQKCEKKNNLS